MPFLARVERHEKLSCVLGSRVLHPALEVTGLVCLVSPVVLKLGPRERSRFGGPTPILRIADGPGQADLGYFENSG